MKKWKLLRFIGGLMVAIGLGVVETASYKCGLNDDFDNLTKTLRDNNLTISDSDGNDIIFEKGKGF